MYSINNKPTVVIDLSWLRGRAFSSLKLDHRLEYLLPDAMGTEILDKDNKTETVDKFIKLIELNFSSLSFSNTISHVISKELSANKPAKPSEFLQRDFNNGLRAGQYEPLELRANFLNTQGWKPEYKAKLEKWKKHLQSHADNFRAQHIEHKKTINQAANRPAEETKLVQQPWAPWIATANSVDHSPIWKNRLSCFPDIWNLGLYGRLIFYCMIQQLFGKTSELENNFDDIEYAFFAIHTGRIATRDDGMVRMIRMCSGTNPIVYKDDIAA